MQHSRTPPLLDLVRRPADLKRLPQESLRELADELRQEVVAAVAVTGGHLGAGLGVVEITVALHYVFDTPADRIVWDVSHQCYPHKILTGRRHRMRTLRQGGGLSGFASRKESEFDPFGAAHSSTSLSAALGFAAARDFAGKSHHVVAVIGDGALSAGMAYEALNNIGAQKRKLIVILNDNNMSIAPPSGALSDYLTSLRGKMLARHDRHAALRDGVLSKATDERTLFDNLGVAYAGPFDGHDIEEMVRVLTLARDTCDGPILLHVVTEKGKGYPAAERAADKYHGVVKFNVATGEQSKSKAAAPSYTAVYASALIAEAERDEKIVAVTAAMPSGTGLDKFGAHFPDRCFDVGIAEQHAVTFCGGLACEGYRPFATIYSTFLQRAYDQVVHDIAIQRLPVRFAMDRAGMVGADGVTHQGSYDIAYLGCLPGFVLMAAADELELMHMVATAAAIDDRPSALRYPRGDGLGLALPERGTPLEIGRGRVLCEGTKIALLCYGTRLADALKAADKLATMGLSTTVADARFAKPIDDDLVRRLALEHQVLLSIEEGSIGGFAAQVLDSLMRQRLSDAVARFHPLYLPDVFIDHDNQQRQIELAGLDATHIVARVSEALGLDARTVLHSVPVVGAE